mgnify:FL=1
MAKFRKVHTAFWDDPLIEKLNPDARYFYLFLMTNPLCTECGIYQITIRKMCNYTGYNEDSIKALIKIFEVDNSRLIYDLKTEEMCLLKKPNYIDNTGTPVVDCLKTEFKNVKNKVLIIKQLQHIEKDAVKKIYDTWYGTSYAPFNKLGQEEEKEEEKEEEEKKALPMILNSNLNRQPNIPTREQVWEVFSRSGGTKVMAKSFWDKWEAVGWFLNGSPITNFSSLANKFIDSWKRNEEKDNPSKLQSPKLK